MNEYDLIQVTGLTAPMFTALLCGVLCLMHYFSRRKDKREKHVLLMVCVFAAAFFCWLGPVLLLVATRLFVRFNPFFFLALMLDQVLLYHFVFIITGTGECRRFSPINYIVPAVITGTVLVWSLFVPFDVQLRMARNLDISHADYPVFSVVFFSSMLVFCIYNLLYTLLGFYRVRQYRREIENYSADVQRTSMKWLYLFMALVLSSIPLPLASLFTENNTILASQITVLAGVLPIIQYTLIVYNLLSDNYVIIEPAAAADPVDPLSTARTPALDCRRFERYVHHKKPYLDPKLRITDLAAGLGTNRTYLSAFINREYGMNFSRYVNRQRLEELDRLRTSAPNASYTNLELVLMAGFSSYRSYLRVKTKEDKSRILKVLE